MTVYIYEGGTTMNYKIQVIEKDGEPYGRYENPYFKEGIQSPGYAEFESLDITECQNW